MFSSFFCVVFTEQRKKEVGMRILLTILCLLVAVQCFAKEFCPVDGQCHEDRSVLANKVLTKRQQEIGGVLKQLKVNLSKRPKMRQRDKEKQYKKALNATIPKEIKDERAQEAYDSYIGSNQQQNMVEKYTQDIWASIREQIAADKRFSGFDPGKLTDFVKANTKKKKYNEKYLLFFVSSSMPVETLRQYVQVFEDNPHVAFVLRGAIGNATRIMPTFRWMSKVLCREGDLWTDKSKCSNVTIDINPRLYRLFGIDRVPAFVYLPDPSVLYKPEIDDSDFYVFFGGMSPEYVLSRIQLVRPEDERLVMLRGWFRHAWENGPALPSERRN
jgi:conjugal transfer pilus assembly protein TrbC